MEVVGVDIHGALEVESIHTRVSKPAASLIVLSVVSVGSPLLAVNRVQYCDGSTGGHCRGSGSLIEVEIDPQRRITHKPPIELLNELDVGSWLLVMNRPYHSVDTSEGGCRSNGC